MEEPKLSKPTHRHTDIQIDMCICAHTHTHTHTRACRYIKAQSDNLNKHTEECQITLLLQCPNSQLVITGPPREP